MSFQSICVMLHAVKNLVIYCAQPIQVCDPSDDPRPLTRRPEILAETVRLLNKDTRKSGTTESFEIHVYVLGSKMPMRPSSK